MMLSWEKAGIRNACVLHQLLLTFECIICDDCFCFVAGRCGPLFVVDWFCLWRLRTAPLFRPWGSWQTPPTVPAETTSNAAASNWMSLFQTRDSRGLSAQDSRGPVKRIDAFNCSHYFSSVQAPKHRQMNCIRLCKINSTSHDCSFGCHQYTSDCTIDSNLNPKP